MFEQETLDSGSIDCVGTGSGTMLADTAEESSCVVRIFAVSNIKSWENGDKQKQESRNERTCGKLRATR